MSTLTLDLQVTTKPHHSWARKINVAFVPGPMTPLLEKTVQGILGHFAEFGHGVQGVPDDYTDILLTTAPNGESINWRRALLFTGRSRFKLQQLPTLVTLVHMRTWELREILDHFEHALEKEPPDPTDFRFPGLAPEAYRVLVEQGRRGGPILSLQRLLQAQAKSIRVLLVVGDEDPEIAYHFDLVGAYPASMGGNSATFYEDIVHRLVTVVCADEINQHQDVGEPLPRSVWEALETPDAMRRAAIELGNRGFFTDMVRIADLVQVPSVGTAVASQYSEGCFATWDVALGALIATITGSARPVDKSNLTEDELAVIVGVRPDGQGALVRHVEGKRNDPPSTEAVELIDMDSALPRIYLNTDWPEQGLVPAVRSKLHGHRGVASYDPDYLEYVPLDEPYFHYLVTCGTDAQARGVKDAFSRSQALSDAGDPRQIAFTLLPGHGLILAEKWVTGKEPFQVIWEAMDAGHVEIASHVPQGPMCYVPAPDGRMVLRETG